MSSPPPSPPSLYRVPFSSVCSLFESLVSVGGRAEATKEIWRWLTRQNTIYGGGEGLCALYQLFLPALSLRNYYMKERTLTRLLKEIFQWHGTKEQSELAKAELGPNSEDLAVIVQRLFQYRLDGRLCPLSTGPANSSSLSGQGAFVNVEFIHNKLNQLSSRSPWTDARVLAELANGPAPPLAADDEAAALVVLGELFAPLKPVEAKWLCRIILMDLQLNYPDKVFFDGLHPLMHEIFLVRTDLREACRCARQIMAQQGNNNGNTNKAENNGRSSQYFDPEPGIFISPQLCERSNGLAQLARYFLRRRLYIEKKYDGERIQIHLISLDRLRERRSKWLISEGGEFLHRHSLFIHRDKPPMIDTRSAADTIGAPMAGFTDDAHTNNPAPLCFPSLTAYTATHCIRLFSRSGRDSSIDRQRCMAALLKAIRFYNPQPSTSSSPSCPPPTGAAHQGAAPVVDELIVDGELLVYNAFAHRVEPFGSVRELAPQSLQINKAGGGPGPWTGQWKWQGKGKRVYNDAFNAAPTSAPPVHSNGGGVVGSSPLLAPASLHEDSSRHYFIVLFDILSHNGLSLFHSPLHRRRALLHSLITPIHRHVEIISAIDVDGTPTGHHRDNSMAAAASVSDAQLLATPCGRALSHSYNECLANNEEGLILKDADSKIQAGVRGGAGWFKLKKDFIPGYGDCVDLLLVGASYERKVDYKYNKGQRNQLTVFTMAARVRPGHGHGHGALYRCLFTVTAATMSREEIRDFQVVLKRILNIPPPSATARARDGRRWRAASGASAIPPWIERPGDGRRVDSPPLPAYWVKRPELCVVVEVYGSGFVQGQLRFPRIRAIKLGATHDQAMGVEEYTELAQRAAVQQPRLAADDAAAGQPMAALVKAGSDAAVSAIHERSRPFAEPENAGWPMKRVKSERGDEKPMQPANTQWLDEGRSGGDQREGREAIKIEQFKPSPKGAVAAHLRSPSASLARTLLPLLRSLSTPQPPAPSPPSPSPLSSWFPGIGASTPTWLKDSPRHERTDAATLNRPFRRPPPDFAKLFPASSLSSANAAPTPHTMASSALFAARRSLSCGSPIKAGAVSHIHINKGDSDDSVDLVKQEHQEIVQ